MRKLILSNLQAPGDIVMLTAAVRDLHLAYPGEFLTDVRTTCPELWENNPYVTSLNVLDRDVRVLPCHYPLIARSNQRPVHFLHGFVEFLNEQLGVAVQPSLFQGDIHLSAAERKAPSLIARVTGADLPYWVIVAGGKYDFTIKWWHVRRWQRVVDAFRGRLLFVQIGEREHYHPALQGVLDLRGRTSLRGLVRLIHHADGVLCPVTLAMHLAAAVECRPGRSPARPCVVVAGGRESPQWEAYPGHQFLHTVGTLPCCAQGGCWRSRSVALGDGSDHDQPAHLCLNTVADLPRCMAEITPEDVMRRIELYLNGETCSTLTQEQFSAVTPFLRHPQGWMDGGSPSSGSNSSFDRAPRIDQPEPETNERTVPCQTRPMPATTMALRSMSGFHLPPWPSSRT